MSKLYFVNRVNDCFQKLFGFVLCLSILGAVFYACSEEEKQIPPPEIFRANDGEEVEVNVGDTISLEPKITYNINASYQWYKNNELLNNKTQVLEDSAVQLGRIEYRFIVNTPYGADSMDIPVDVIILADFEDLTLDEKKDTFWVGASGTDSFTHKEVLSFENSFQDNTTWKGFGYSNIYSNTQTEDKIPSYAVYGSSSSTYNIFGLVRQPNEEDQYSPSIHFNDGENHKLKSIEINNTTLGYYLLKFGTDNFERMGGSGSSEPDWCKVTITGINTGGEASSIDFYLADYRFENNKRDYIITEWTEIDLADLGSVNQIRFTISSSKTDTEGKMITPEEICIDNLKVLD
jgi:hypothetical protein